MFVGLSANFLRKASFRNRRHVGSRRVVLQVCSKLWSSVSCHKRESNMRSLWPYVVCSMSTLDIMIVLDGSFQSYTMVHSSPSSGSAREIHRYRALIGQISERYMDMDLNGLAARNGRLTTPEWLRFVSGVSEYTKIDACTNRTLNSWRSRSNLVLQRGHSAKSIRMCDRAVSSISSF